MTILRDTVVIGASTGGIEALSRILPVLGRDFPAAVLVVQHLSDRAGDHLADIFRRQTELEIRWAAEGDSIQPGRAYLAPPGAHMVIVDSTIQLLSTARENFVRPSIDKLFRSVAAARGARAIGVLLTGLLDDGVAGLDEIRAAGGYTIVQDPETAAARDMPVHAIERVEIDEIVPLDRIGLRLTKLAGTAAMERRPLDPVVAESRLDRDDPASIERTAALGTRLDVACPECGGPMWKVRDAYRCYLGHVMTGRTLLERNHDQVEGALWTAVRALFERAMTLNDLANTAADMAKPLAEHEYRARSLEAKRQAETLRAFVLELVGSLDRART